MIVSRNLVTKLKNPVLVLMHEIIPKKLHLKNVSQINVKGFSVPYSLNRNRNGRVIRSVFAMTILVEY